MQLSKSLYLRGLQCSKSLWLKKYKPEVLTPPSEQAQDIFKTGGKVGDLACQLFPGGKKIPYEGTTYNEKVALTQLYIDQGIKNIYEASFVFDDIFIMVDILHINDDGSVQTYEVKSSTWNEKKKTLKDIQHYINDVSIQYYVLNGLGFELSKCSLTLLDATYKYKDRLEVDKLFTHVDVTKEVKELQADIPTYLGTFRRFLKDRENEPGIDIGAQCKKPYLCDAYEYCWKVQKEIPEYSVFDIFNMGDKPVSLYKKGVIEIADIPDDAITTDNQRLIVDAWLNKSTFIDKETIGNFIKGLKYPIYHLDFETFQSAIPEFDKQSPYQQIVFQYSLHIEHEDGTLVHKEFLGKEGTDPRTKVIENMVKDIEQDSTILVFNESFEKARIKELIQDFPQYANELQKIYNNIVDLAVPFQKKYYYDYRLMGKYSIKLVMPLLVPHMAQSYKELNFVQNGADAMNIFPKLVDMDESTKSLYRKALLEYCKLDTLAMVEILKKLKEEFTK
ncbi:MAG: DUF2779 domain-containing protein [Sulfurovum sp.]|nr:DUF2779 domain-containing protein [Sulfurovum sp.]